MKKSLLLILALIDGFVVSAYGQTTPPPVSEQTVPIIEIDNITNTPKTSIPFDREFVLKKTYDGPVSVRGVGYHCKEKEDSAKRARIRSVKRTHRIAVRTMRQDFSKKADLRSARKNHRKKLDTIRRDRTKRIGIAMRHRVEQVADNDNKHELYIYVPVLSSRSDFAQLKLNI